MKKKYTILVTPLIIFLALCLAPKSYAATSFYFPKADEFHLSGLSAPYQDQYASQDVQIKTDQPYQLRLTGHPLTLSADQSQVPYEVYWSHDEQAELQPLESKQPISHFDSTNHNAQITIKIVEKDLQQAANGNYIGILNLMIEPI